MKKKICCSKLAVLHLFFILFGVNSLTMAKDASNVVPVIQDKLLTCPSNLTNLDGYLGQKINLCIQERIQETGC